MAAPLTTQILVLALACGRPAVDLATHVVNQVLWLCLARPHCCPQLHPPCPCRLLDQQRSSVELKRWKLCCNTTQPIQHSWRSFLSSCSHVNGVDTGFVAPPGEELARGLQPNATFDDDDPSTLKHGWQLVASLKAAIAPQGTGATLRSQSGPLASALFTCCAVARHTTTRRSFVSCSSDACGSPPAGVAVRSIFVATPVQHTLWRGSFGAAGLLWSQLRPTCVAKRGPHASGSR